MPDVLYALDNHLEYHYVLRALGVLVTLGLALGPRRTRLWFFAALVVTFFIFRWPAIYSFAWIDIDEGYPAAAAIHIMHGHIVPWKDFHTETIGPLEIYPAVLPALVGLPITLRSTRFIGDWIWLAGFIALFYAFRRFFNETASRLAVLPVTFFLAANPHSGYLHYNTELVSLTLWCLAVAWLARAAVLPTPRSYYLTGLALGAMPFGKLQASVLAAATFAVAAAAAFFAPQLEARAKRINLALLVAGTATTTAFFFVVGLVTGSLEDIWVMWILASIAYRSQAPWPISWLFVNDGWTVFFTGMLVALAGGAVALVRYRPLRAIEWRILLGAVVLLMGGVYSTFAPNHGTDHYHLYTAFPVTLLAGCMLGILAGRTTGLRARGVLAAAFVAATVVPVLVENGATVSYYNSYSRMVTGSDGDDVTRLMAPYVKLGQTLAIWGWDPEYLVYTQTDNGTRFGHTAFAMYNYLSPYRDYFRKKFYEDFIASRPAAFLDAEYQSKNEEENIDFFPDLRAYVDAHYKLVAAIPRVGDAHAFGLYVRVR